MKNDCAKFHSFELSQIIIIFFVIFKRINTFLIYKLDRAGQNTSFQVFTY